ncbi:MAG: EamA family transporter RarD [Opitutae bacterium]|nr:EamA family transporter RarD [Opitutae bacterium]
MPDETHNERTRGVIAAAGSFFFWGVVPVYWKQMQGIAAIELIAHRIVWSLLFLLGLLWWQKNLATLRPAFAEARAVGRNLLSSLLLAANWTVYIWAVNSGHVIEASLGYFLVPLVNVALGSVLLHERLRPLQWTAIAFAAAGVLSLLFGVGHVPWIALSLAVTWSGYGFFKKLSALGPLAGLTVETLLLFPVAAAALLWWHHTGEGALGRVDAWHHVLVLSVGVVTAIPLLLFAYGAQRIRLATLGLLQYLSPTVQFFIGLLVYHEVFDAGRFRAYALIWCGLILYTADSFWAQRHRLRKPAAA